MSRESGRADVENCRLDDLSLSQDLIHEHIGMKSHCFSDGGAREEEKQFDVREGWFELVFLLKSVTVDCVMEVLWNKRCCFLLRFVILK